MNKNKIKNFEVRILNDVMDIGEMKYPFVYEVLRYIKMNNRVSIINLKRIFGKYFINKLQTNLTKKSIEIFINNQKFLTICSNKDNGKLTFKIENEKIFQYLKNINLLYIPSLTADYISPYSLFVNFGKSYKDIFKYKQYIIHPVSVIKNILTYSMDEIIDILQNFKEINPQSIDYIQFLIKNLEKIKINKKSYSLYGKGNYLFINKDDTPISYYQSKIIIQTAYIIKLIKKQNIVLYPSPKEDNYIPQEFKELIQNISIFF